MSSSDQPSPSASAAAAAASIASSFTPPDPIDEVSINGYLSEDIGFRTPTSGDHRIPRSRSCPPAPRKLRPVSSMAHKRKLTFEDAAWEEVETFFERFKSKRRSLRSLCSVPANGIGS